MAIVASALRLLSMSSPNSAPLLGFGGQLPITILMVKGLHSSSML